MPALADFLAQSADNSKPMILMHRGVRLDDDDPRRADLVSAISRVPSKGRSILQSESIGSFILDDQAAISLRPLERDVAGRGAPILFRFSLPEVRKTDDWRGQITTEVEAFLDICERSISDQAMEELAEAFDVVDSKLRGGRAKFIFVATAIAVGAATVSIAISSLVCS